MAKKAKPVGNRTENRGHWTKGKRRNDPGDDWPAVLKRLARLLRTPERRRNTDTEDRVRRSRHGLGDYLGVSERQVRRWLAGDDLPNAETVAKIKQFCDSF